MDALAQSILAASVRPEVLSAVEALYADVQAEIDARRPVCVMSGRCCRFEEYGHRLYVTTMELGAFLAEWRKEGRVWPSGTGDVAEVRSPLTLAPEGSGRVRLSVGVPGERERSGVP